jgi:MFS transporter, DHA1 family, inner membrane transport protein
VTERAIPVLAAASFATATQSFVFAGLLSEIAADLEQPVAAVGQLGTVFALAFGLAALPVARATAGFGRRRLIVGALLLLGALNLALALAPGFAALIALRLACGVVAAAVIPAAAAAAATLAAPERRGRALGLVVAGTTAAFLVGIPVGSVAGDLFGWRGAFVFSAAIAVAAAIPVATLTPEVPPAAAPTGGIGALRRPGIPAALGLMLAGFAAVFCFAAYIGPGVNRVTGLTGAWVGMMQAMVGVAALIGAPLGGRLADRRGMGAAWMAVAAILVGQALQTVLLAGAAAGSGVAVPTQALAILLTAGGLFALTPMIQARLVALAPDARGIVLAGSSAAATLGQAAGAALGGVAIAAFGLAGIGAAGVAVGLLALALLRHAARAVPHGA